MSKETKADEPVYFSAHIAEQRVAKKLEVDVKDLECMRPEIVLSLLFMEACDEINRIRIELRRKI